MSGIACGTASFAASVPWRLGIVGMFLGGSKTRRITCRDLCVCRVLGHQRSPMVPVDNAVGCCIFALACSVSAFPRQ